MYWETNFWDLDLLSFVERSIILCPFVGSFTSTVHNLLYISVQCLNLRAVYNYISSTCIYNVMCCQTI